MSVVEQKFAVVHYTWSFYQVVVLSLSLDREFAHWEKARDNGCISEPRHLSWGRYSSATNPPEGLVTFLQELMGRTYPQMGVVPAMTSASLLQGCASWTVLAFLAYRLVKSRSCSGWETTNLAEDSFKGSFSIKDGWRLLIRLPRLRQPKPLKVARLGVVTTCRYTTSLFQVHTGDKSGDEKCLSNQVAKDAA